MRPAKGIIAFGNVNDMNEQENGENVVVTSALAHGIGPEPRHRAGQGRHRRRGLRMDHDGQGGASLAFYEFEGKIPADVKAKVAEAEAAIKAGKA